MKNWIFKTMVVLLSFSSSLATAQEVLKEGQVTMEFTNIESSDEAMAAQMQMLKGSQTIISFDENQYMSDMNMMGGMITMKSVVNSGSGKMDMFMDMMGNKMWIDTNMDEAAEGRPKQDDVTITYDKADTKKILGYNAYKMVVKNPDMGEGHLEAYITEDIKSDAKFVQGFEQIKFAGFPLELKMVTPMITITMETVDIKKEVPAGSFDIDKAGYTKMTMEEFTKQMGGMGGLGF